MVTEMGFCSHFSLPVVTKVLKGVIKQKSPISIIKDIIKKGDDQERDAKRDNEV